MVSNFMEIRLTVLKLPSQGQRRARQTESEHVSTFCGECVQLGYKCHSLCRGSEVLCNYISEVGAGQFRDTAVLA
jgi:hypothetical protein